MTVRLYNEDPYIRKFTANILEVHEKEGKFHILLNRTAFYPESGGQPCDTGIIGDVDITYTYEESDNIYHVGDKAPSGIENLVCEIDWERRFDHMQQHLGQHILSAVLADSFKADTVGFHIGSINVTIDINRILEKDDLERAEHLCNLKVFDNLPVDVFYPSEQELTGLKVRKLPQVNEKIRIVRVKDTDINACCGTHPSMTGEVGLVKIIKWEKYKGGLRIEFACGLRALRDYIWKNETINDMAYTLAFKDTEILHKVIDLKEELSRTQKECSLLKEKLLSYEAAELLESTESNGAVKIVRSVFDGRPLNDLRALTAKLLLYPGVVVLFGLRQKENAQIIFGRSKEINNVKIKDVFKEALELLGGNGGGSDLMSQGGGKNLDKLEEALELSHDRILGML